MIGSCPKCDGRGVRPRTKDEDGTEADSDLHPMISGTPKVCETCGGSGRLRMTQAEIDERAKQ